MGTTISLKRFTLRSTDSSSLGDIDHGEPTHHDVGKSLHKTPNARAVQKVDSGSTAESDVAAFSGLLPESIAQDVLDGSLFSPSQETLAQVAEGNLIDRIISGHKELFMDLIRPHQRTVYATVFSLLANKEEAEDVTQETLLKGLVRLNQFRRESTFGTWLIQIAINEARMRNRKRWRVPMLSLTHNKKDDEKSYIPRDFEDWREIPSAALERAEIREVLVKALGSLAQHYREAFVLRDIQELSTSETSAILGISPGAVKTRLRRARLMLRDMLAPGLGQDGQVGWVSKEVRKPWE
jgi:RNA polymerase sigma-70 factor (ECF subfamily)